jgi:DNA-binding MarR family transcriptional regulator
MSSEMDATSRPGTAHVGPPPGWRTSELSEGLYAVLNAMPDLRAAIAHRLGLNVSEVDAMQHVMAEAMGPVELSRRLHMTSASATVLVDRLEEAGHVVREPDPHDGRRRVVRPTSAGATSVFEQIGPLVADLVSAEEGMSARERAAVTAYLSRVLDVLRAHTEDVDPPR